MFSLVFLVAGGPDDQDGPDEKDEPDEVREARRKLQDAMRPPRRPPMVGQKVDKYFGAKLPPVCERLGCYLSDDGKRFYCVNPSCQKHKKRRTKHNRKGPTRGPKPNYFRCPKCQGRKVDLHLLSNRYECRSCQHTWPRDPPAKDPPK